MKRLIRSLGLFAFTLVVGFLVAIVVLVVALGSVQLLLRDDSLRMLGVVGLVAAFGGILVGFPLFGLTVIRWRNRVLDAGFVPNGLTGESLMWSSRYWTGTTKTLKTDAYLMHGPLIEVLLHHHNGVRLAIAHKRPLSSLGGLFASHEPLQTVPVRLEGSVVYPGEHRAWSEKFIARPRVEDALVRLLGEDLEGCPVTIRFQPEGTSLMVQGLWPGLLTEDRVSRWLSTLHELCQEVEKQGPADPVVEESEAERRARLERVDAFKKGARFTQGCVLLLFVFVFGSLGIVVGLSVLGLI